MARNFSNTAGPWTLASAINASTTSVAVNEPTTDAPAVDFAVEVNGEVMLVTANNTGTRTFTVTRGYDGTTAASHDASDAALHRGIADDLKKIHELFDGQASADGLATLDANTEVDHFTAPGKQGFVSLANPRYGLNGDGTTQNAPSALQAAVNEALSKKLPLYVPKGKRYLIQFTAVDDSVDVPANNELDIFGGGAILAGPEKPTFAYNLFEVGVRSRIRVFDVTISGPKNGLTPTNLTFDATSGSATITITSGTVEADDDERYISLPGAGSGGSTLRAKVNSVDTGANTYVVNTAPSTSVSGGTATIYRDAIVTNGLKHHGGKLDTISISYTPGSNVITGSFEQYHRKGYVTIDYTDTASSAKTFDGRITHVKEDGTEAYLGNQFPDDAQPGTDAGATVDVWTEVLCKNVTFTGQFWEAIEHDGGAGILSLMDCDVSALVQGVACWSDDEDSRISDHKHYTAINTDFHDLGLPANGDGNEHPGQANGHANYIHPNVALLIEDCRYTNINGKDSVAHFSAGGIAASKPLKYAIYKNVYIDSGERTVLTTKNGKSIFINPDFNTSNEGIDLREEVEIYGGSIIVTGSGRGLSDSNADPSIGFDLLVRDTVVESFQGNAVACENIPAGDFVWKFINSRVKSGHNNGCILQRDIEYRFEKGTKVEGQENNTRAIDITAGSLILGRDAEVRAFGTYAVFLSNSAGLLELDGCSLVGQVRNFGASTLEIKGRAKEYGGINFGTAQGSGYFGLSNRVNPSAVASAASVTVSPNYATHHISGTTQIDNLYIKGSGLQDSQPFRGVVTLILDGGLTFGSTGNLTLVTTGARAAGSVAQFYIDGQNQTAVEVGAS